MSQSLSASGRSSHAIERGGGMWEEYECDNCHKQHFVTATVLHINQANEQWYMQMADKK
jgi:hypothetical protein